MQLWPVHHEPGVSGFLTDHGSLYTQGGSCAPFRPPDSHVVDPWGMPPGLCHFGSSCLLSKHGSPGVARLLVLSCVWPSLHPRRSAVLAA